MRRLLFGAKSVGFLAMHNLENTEYLGSFLITDFKGIPIEFRCTESVKRNPVQISLYGDTFLPYVGIELLGKPLIRSVKNKPELIFVEALALLDLADHVPDSVVYVKPSNEESTPMLSETVGFEYHTEDLQSNSGTFKPLRIIQKKEV